jgi:uncharacterized membrane protein YccF (DUF307 family)
MRWLRNGVHLLTGGLVLAAAWFAAGVVLWLFRDTRSLAGPCLAFARFQLCPEGKEPVRAAQASRYQHFVRTGRVPDERPARPKSASRIAAQHIVWAPFALVLASGHLVHGLIEAGLRFSSPRRSASFLLLSPCFFPHGWQIGWSSPARHRIFAAGLGARNPAFRHPDHGWATRCKPPLLAAVLVLWTSISGEQPPLAGAAVSSSGSAVAGNWPAWPAPISSTTGREAAQPQARPPLPIKTAARAESGERGCGAPKLHAVAVRLSRRHLDFALPLGSRQIGAHPGTLQVAAVSRVDKLQRLAASMRNARVQTPVCLGSVAAHAVRTERFAAGRAAVLRLAGKAGPDRYGRASDFAQPALSRSDQHVQILKVQNLIDARSPAKAPGRGRVEEIAARIVRAGGLR